MKCVPETREYRPDRKLFHTIIIKYLRPPVVNMRIAVYITDIYQDLHSQCQGILRSELQRAFLKSFHFESGT